MFTRIGEPVQVETFFSAGRVLPRWFLWKGRKIAVKRVTQSWQEKDGGRKLYHFAAWDGCGLFDLVFEPERMRWELAGVCDDDFQDDNTR